MFRFMGLLSIIPATVLLTISFFVIYATKKSEGEGLKKFGMVVAVLLWLCSLLIFTAGVTSVFIHPHNGMFKHPGCCEMKGGMDEKGQCCNMMKKKGDMKGMETPEKGKMK